MIINILDIIKVKGDLIATSNKFKLIRQIFENFKNSTNYLIINNDPEFGIQYNSLHTTLVSELNQILISDINGDNLINKIGFESYRKYILTITLDNMLNSPNEYVCYVDCVSATEEHDEFCGPASKLDICIGNICVSISTIHDKSAVVANPKCYGNLFTDINLILLQLDKNIIIINNYVDFIDRIINLLN